MVAVNSSVDRMMPAYGNKFLPDFKQEPISKVIPVSDFPKFRSGGRAFFHSEFAIPDNVYAASRYRRYGARYR